MQQEEIMQLLTKSIEKSLEKHPFYSTESQGTKARVIVKFFNPTGAGTWLVTEGEKQEDGDWLFFGYAHINEWEIGYFSLSELSNIKLPFGMKIERDKYSKGTVEELMSGVY